MDATKRSRRGKPFNRLKGLRLLRAFVENPRQVATVVASSPALLRELAGLACLRTARRVVELGPGTGETTQALLDALPSEARLLGIEVVPTLVDELRRVADSRLHVELGDAIDLPAILERRGSPPADVVVSGIPFSHLTLAEGRRMIAAIDSSLAPGGSFVAYQFRDRVCEFANVRFGTPQKTFIPWNIPPLDLYVWTKAAGEHAGNEIAT